jgi:membrane-anchored protein YejM (alkaline phosphatase superfamily)
MKLKWVKLNSVTLNYIHLLQIKNLCKESMWINSFQNFLFCLVLSVTFMYMFQDANVNSNLPNSTQQSPFSEAKI